MWPSTFDAPGPGVDPMTDRRGRSTVSREQRAENLKERVYVTFTSLTIVLALQTHADQTAPGAAAATLVIGVVGTLLAVFLADLLSHLTVHARIPTRKEFAHMVHVSIGSIGVVFLPLIFLAVAGIGAWTTSTALGWSAAVLLMTLAVVGYLAVRRVTLPLRHKAAILFAEVVLGALVIGLELLAHG